MSSIYTANIPNPHSIGSPKVAARLAGRGSAGELPVPLPAAVLVQVVRAIRGIGGLGGRKRGIFGRKPMGSDGFSEVVLKIFL